MNEDASCEVCGAEGGAYIALIEGARLHVCRNCSLLGKIIYSPQPVRERRMQGAPAALRVDFELVDDYAQKIRNAREKMRITTAVLAELCNEKESFIDRIEKGGARPGEGLARKLEKELGIKLLEPAQASTQPSAASPQRSLSSGGGRTLGDVIEIEKKKK